MRVFFVIGNIWLSLIANTYKHVILTYTHLNKYFWLFAIIFKFILSHLKYWPGLDFIQFISKEISMEICLLIESGGSFIFYVLWHLESSFLSLLISWSYKYYATHNRDCNRNNTSNNKQITINLNDLLTTFPLAKYILNYYKWK